MKKIFWLVPILLLSACGMINPTSAAPTPTLAATSNAIIAEAHVVPSRSQVLAFAASGRIDSLNVKQGDPVKKDQVLATLTDREQAQAALAAAQLALVSAQQNLDTLNRTAGLATAQAWQAYMDSQKVRQAAKLALDKLDLSTIQTDIDNAKSDMTSRQTDLDNAQADFDKYKDLAIDNATRKSFESALRTAQTNYDQAVQKWEDLINNRDKVQAALNAALASEAEAKRTYQVSQSGPNTDRLALAQAALDNAKAQQAAAQNALDNFDLKAPFDGTIMDVNVSENQLVGPQTWIVSIADTSAWYVDTSDLNELDVVKVSQGQKVSVTADALPGVKMTGVVERIGQTPINQGTDVLYTLHIKLDNPDPRLRWGMTTEVTLDGGE